MTKGSGIWLKVGKQNLASGWGSYPYAGLDQFDRLLQSLWQYCQIRTHNTANEIATIQVWGAVVHDPVGNMTRIPKPSSPANRYACIWDAWNRLVEVKETDANGNPTTTVAVYAYDGFYRRTKKVIGAGTRDYYYSLGWQVLEERVGGALDRQFVWGIRHIDDLVLRERGAERLYAVHDAMHVTAVTNASGAVQERYGYEGFGKPRFMDASFGARASSSFDWETLFDGYRFDTETGFYQVRFRYLHPGLGRWVSRDPIEYFAGTNLYAYVFNNPVRMGDASGLESSMCWKYYDELDNLVDDIAKCEEMFAENPFKEPALDALRRAWKEMYDACIKAGCKNCDRDKDDGGDRPPGPELVPVGSPDKEPRKPWEKDADDWKNPFLMPAPVGGPNYYSRTNNISSQLFPDPAASHDLALLLAALLAAGAAAAYLFAKRFRIPI